LTIALQKLLLIVGSSRCDDVPAELDHISNSTANLRLNPGKSREMIISQKQEYNSQPKQNADIKRVKSMKILGVIINDKLRAADHVGQLSIIAQDCYMLYGF